MNALLIFAGINPVKARWRNEPEHGKKAMGGDICGRGRRYPRTSTEISADTGGDIRAQSPRCAAGPRLAGREVPPAGYH